MQEFILSSARFHQKSQISHTVKSFEDNERINFLFFSWKLLNSITVEMLAYRCDLYLSGTAETQWLCEPL